MYLDILPVYGIPTAQLLIMVQLIKYLSLYSTIYWSYLTTLADLLANKE